MTIDAIKFNTRNLLEVARQYSELKNLPDESSKKRAEKALIYMRNLLSSLRKLLEEERQNAV